MADALIGRFRLGGDASAAVRQVFEHPAGANTGLLSVVLLVFSGVSLTRRLQRMYQQAWELPPNTGLRNSLNAMLGLATLVLEIALLYFARLPGPAPADRLGARCPALGRRRGPALDPTPWLLLDRRLRWSRLLPAGCSPRPARRRTGCQHRVHAAVVRDLQPALRSVRRDAGAGGLAAVHLGHRRGGHRLAAQFDRDDDAWARRLRARLRIQAVGTPVDPSDDPVGSHAPPGGVTPTPAAGSCAASRGSPRSCIVCSR